MTKQDTLQDRLHQFLSSVVELVGDTDGEGIEWNLGTDTLEMALEDAKVVVDIIEQLLELKRKSV